MKSYTIKQYLDAGCQEMEVPAMTAVHGMTGGKVCDTGCHAFDSGKCPAYKKLVAVKIQVKAPRHQSTNKDFSKNSMAFIAACETADLKPTSRQASKFRNGKGLAFKASKKVVANGR